jgi:hypothetical protein
MSDLPPESDPEGLVDAWNDLLPGIEIARMTEDELRAFVLGVLDGRIFTNHHIPKASDLPMVFMPLICDPFSRYNPDSLKIIGCLYEHYDQALPRSINGFPCFASFRILHLEDWKRAHTAIVAEQERRKAIPV